jgi:hypothetical protein
LRKLALIDLGIVPVDELLVGFSAWSGKRSLPSLLVEVLALFKVDELTMSLQASREAVNSL